MEMFSIVSTIRWAQLADFRFVKEAPYGETKDMVHHLTTLVLVSTLAVFLPHAAAQISVAGITEGRGPGATAGQSLKNGYVMAIDEINASGGVLGQKIELTQFDIDTSPSAAEEATKKALLAKPFAVLGPQFSGITAASMKFTADSSVPQFTGGEASSLTRRFHLPARSRTPVALRRLPEACRRRATNRRRRDVGNRGHVNQAVGAVCKSRIERHLG